MIRDAIGVAVKELTESSQGGSNRSNDKVRSVNIDGRTYAYHTDDDYLYSSRGVDVYADRSFREKNDDSKGHVNGITIKIGKDGTSSVSYNRVTISSCTGGEILLQSSENGVDWGAQRYSDEKFVKDGLNNSPA